MRNWILALVSLAAFALNTPALFRLARNGCRMAKSWRDGFRSTGEHVDAARRMASCARERGKSVSYCCSGGVLQPIDRSRVLAMSWVTAPSPVRYGDLAKILDSEAIVASSYDPDAESILSKKGFSVKDTGGGLNFWVRGKGWECLGRTLQSTVRGEAFSVFALMFLLLCFLFLRGFSGLIIGLTAVSVVELIAAVVFNSVCAMSAVSCAALAFCSVKLLKHEDAVQVKDTLRTETLGCGVLPWWTLVGLLFAAYAALALTHTFVAPNGLGTVGGKARLISLVKGIPPGFFTVEPFLPYQPSYPPGAAGLVTWCYALSGVCGEWLMQLLPCFSMALLAGFIVRRSCSSCSKVLVVAMFMSPLSVRLATLFYPEVYVAMCVVIGWERIRVNRNDWLGWVIMGLAGWFKNEGLIYFASILVAVLLTCPSCEWRRPLLCATCGLILPVLWHLGCRCMGATLDGFVKFFDASGIKGWMAFVRVLEYVFVKPWGYAFVFPLGIVCLFLRHKKTQLYIIAMSVCFSVSAFCLVFSMSGAADFEWHLDSLERLLWVPALLLLRECLPLIANGTFGIFKILRNAEHQLATRKRPTAFLLTAVLLGLPFAAFAVTANNVFVTVSSSTAGVEGIFPVGGDFYVTTRGVTNPPFRADIGISANSPYYLVKPSSGRMNLTVGENEEYRVRDESGAEDSFTGRVYVVKIEIEQRETNVCRKASSCKLKLTDDSVPGGVAVWTSNPAGISGSGNSITFNPSALSAGEYTVTVKSSIVPSYTDTCIVRVVKVAGLERQIGAAVEWRCFDKPQKILYRKDSRVRAITVPVTELCASAVLWEGSYGIQGTGLLKFHTYNGRPSVSDVDLKSVATNCGPDPNENFLICPFVVGIHSDAGSEDSFLDKHAWITVTSFQGTSPVTVSIGLWGNKPKRPNGSDVHIGYEAAVGRYNRYFLMAPSQTQALVQFVGTKCEWSYFYTCANWAEDGYRIASGETISSRDYVVFGTPRAVGESIVAAERISPTRVDIPGDGGEDAPSSSFGSSDGAESSFP